MTTAHVISLIAAILGPGVTLFIHHLAGKRNRERIEREQSRSIDDLRLEISTRFTKLESKMEQDEKYRDERNATMLMHMKDIVYKYCQNECPRSRQNTNPRIRQYGGDMLP